MIRCISILQGIVILVIIWFICWLVGFADTTKSAIHSLAALLVGALLFDSYITQSVCTFS